MNKEKTTYINHLCVHSDATGRCACFEAGRKIGLACLLKEREAHHTEMIKLVEDELFIHTHNSIPGYYDEEDMNEGCTICFKNKPLIDLLAKLKNNE